MKRKYRYFGYKLANTKTCQCKKRRTEVYEEFHLQNYRIFRLNFPISSLRTVCKHCFIEKVADTDKRFLQDQSDRFEKQQMRFIVHVLDNTQPDWLSTEQADIYFNNKKIL